MNKFMEYWPALAFGFNFLLGWLILTAKKHFASKEDVALLERRVDKVEAAFEQLPKRDDITGLRVALAEVNGTILETRSDMRGLRGLVERTENAVTRHEQIFSDAARRLK